MTEYEFDRLKTGDFVRDPNRGLKVIFTVEGKSRNRVRGLEGIHRDMTVREWRENDTRTTFPSYIIQNAEIEQWEVISPEIAKMADLLYSEDKKHGLHIADGTGFAGHSHSGGSGGAGGTAGSIIVKMSTPVPGQGGFKWKF